MARNGVVRMLNTVLSILVLAGIALLIGAFLLWRKGGASKQAALMVVLALLCFINVAIWTVPTADGTAPVDRLAGEAAGEETAR